MEDAWSWACSRYGSAVSEAAEKVFLQQSPGSARGPEWCWVRVVCSAVSTGTFTLCAHKGTAIQLSRSHLGTAESGGGSDKDKTRQDKAPFDSGTREKSARLGAVEMAQTR